MLEDLSAHILDVAQNSVAAGAKRVDVTVRRGVVANFFDFQIADDGCGMDEARARAALSPFCTSRTTRRVGMGLPFLKQNAELCGGEFRISSAMGRGTRVFASFALDNIDVPPTGDLAGAFLTLLIDAPGVRWIFRYESSGEPFTLDSEEAAEAIDGLESLKIPVVALALKDMIEAGVREADRPKP
ncbi:MAG: ATP-binding protein [Synergistaceae bacterium]|nr:ATP-binding protein [Synergistaceae bacterium]